MYEKKQRKDLEQGSFTDIDQARSLPREGDDASSLDVEDLDVEPDELLVAPETIEREIEETKAFATDEQFDDDDLDAFIQELDAKLESGAIEQAEELDHGFSSEADAEDEIEVSQLDEGGVEAISQINQAIKQTGAETSDAEEPCDLTEIAGGRGNERGATGQASVEAVDIAVEPEPEEQYEAGIFPEPSATVTGADNVDEALEQAKAAAALRSGSASKAWAAGPDGEDEMFAEILAPAAPRAGEKPAHGKTPPRAAPWQVGQGRGRLGLPFVAAALGAVALGIAGTSLWWGYNQGQELSRLQSQVSQLAGTVATPRQDPMLDLMREDMHRLQNHMDVIRGALLEIQQSLEAPVAAAAPGETMPPVTQNQEVEKQRPQTTGSSQSDVITPAVSATAVTRPQQREVTQVTAPVQPVVGGWQLSLASLSNRAHAQTELVRLQAAGIDAVVQPAEVKGRTWYRLILPGFFSKAAAQKESMRLKKEVGLQQIWVKKAD